MRVKDFISDSNEKSWSINWTKDEAAMRSGVELF